MKRLKNQVSGLVLGIAAMFISVTFVNANTVEVHSDFLIPDGTLIDATLNQRLRANRLNEGSRFTLTVTSPQQYRGAVIHGYVMEAKRSGRLTGTSEMVLNFDRIRFQNRDYQFSGIVESVRTSAGDPVGVDREGVVTDSSQTDRTVGRTAVGAVAGTIIGAVAGGGSGAAKGAVIGGGLGAGSVLVQGRSNMDLRENAMMTIRAGAPNF